MENHPAILSGNDRKRAWIPLGLLSLGFVLFAVNVLFYQGEKIPYPDAVPPPAALPAHWLLRLKAGEQAVFTASAKDLSGVFLQTIPVLEINPDRKMLVSFGAPLRSAHLRIRKPLQSKSDGNVYLYSAPGRILQDLPPPAGLMDH